MSRKVRTESAAEAVATAVAAAIGDEQFSSQSSLVRNWYPRQHGKFHQGDLRLNQDHCKEITRQGNVAVEVEKLKLQFFESESTRLADMELASKLDGRCATLASACKERQGLIRDVIELLNGDDILKVLKAILASSTQMQLQSDESRVTR